MIDEGSYENMRRIGYDAGDGIGCATFVPVCEKCGRFIKADKTVMVNEINGLSNDFNATCKKCGRTHMIFEGFT